MDFLSALLGGTTGGFFSAAVVVVALRAFAKEGDERPFSRSQQDPGRMPEQERSLFRAFPNRKGEKKKPKVHDDYSVWAKEKERPAPRIGASPSKE